MDLPYTTYSATTTYRDTKPVASIKDSQYIVRDDNGNAVPNPYIPGNVANTPRSERNVTIHVTPDYDSCVAQGVDNCILTNSNPQFPRNLIFQRVYYPNRRDPETDRPFIAALDYDRMGYTRPGKITCVEPNALHQERSCPRFPIFQDLPLINVNLGRVPFPNLQEQHNECPYRTRWDRPQAFWTHWAGAGPLGPEGPPPDVSLSCTGYLLSFLYPLAQEQVSGSYQDREVPANMVFMTFIQDPPTFFDVSQLAAGDGVPDNPEPDTRYMGIQNYGTEFSDVRYNEQSASVNENPTFPDNLGQGTGESLVFLHYARPLANMNDETTIRNWGRIHNVRVQQLALYQPPGSDNPDRHAPFLIYRQKETSEAFKNSGHYVRAEVPCYTWTDPSDPLGPKRPITDSPLDNAADEIYIGSAVPVTVGCEFTPPITDADLNECLQRVLNTDQSWFDASGQTTCQQLGPIS